VIFLADEGVDRQIVERLRLDGHEVSYVYVAEMAPGIMDEVVLSESRNSESVLITADKDFGELVFRQRQALTGVLLIRLWASACHEGLGGLHCHSRTCARIAGGLCRAESCEHPHPAHAPSVGTEGAYIP
jgi:predicted nuclease of predicted toxin-antitoxin system